MCANIAKDNSLKIMANINDPPKKMNERELK